jgi:hypothetical protein
MGHHHPWLGGHRSDEYFGIRPGPSEALVAVIARRPQIAGYFAGTPIATACAITRPPGPCRTSRSGV